MKVRNAGIETKPSSNRHGNGSDAGGQVGHRLNRNGKRIYLIGGNGCLAHKDCFTCPEPDCTYTDYGKGLD